MHSWLSALAALEGQDRELAFGIGLFVVSFIVLFTLLKWQRSSRSKKIAATLTPLGLAFRAAATPEDTHLLDGFILGDLYARANPRRKRIHNIARHSGSESGAMAIFDCEFLAHAVLGEGTLAGQGFEFTAARVSHSEMRPPVFFLTSRDWGDRLKTLFPLGAIEFPDDPEFNRLFRLQGHDTAALRAYFSAELRHALKPHARLLELEGRDGHLLYFVTPRRQASRIREFVEQARTLAQLFRRPMASMPSPQPPPLR